MLVFGSKRSCGLGRFEERLGEKDGKGKVWVGLHSSPVLFCNLRLRKIVLHLEFYYVIFSFVLMAFVFLVFCYKNGMNLVQLILTYLSGIC